ncbi:MAG: hypothetical protein A3C30_00655 [Candidatus Levybacteria bacterium RIFCSPHIGHO2_02_FULL_40_18]|nr:MAG: hypothetical protein A2869_03275 [Candidatus Levybacteria bacterium RIFCSPHIGHO2_01_FULL_40_58]OGH27211.1 MAG: hypothetical protein A3C30_00655 [Candidatus Levybacteria bacterium RIFCSPHIGHO2_02_FULL_40_18]OGH31070.1 MAG: hypothetical protein A3E43_05070 [Candidatus Levybacteria bacterium RIFCSPHIGHO2_12_FULL_40_31]OGH40762.1 MAG: hypothetical protein A2894_03370 [Candidatus Levybacteria bacterium RIFCSPLOWO2_01_FULL_40_64]OGH49400.1 MAG: hypothetical protein A3I54_02010 [Candidatus Lev
MKRPYFLLLLIFLLGTFLRFFALGDIPVSLHRDEAFLGYNAYSILETGRDISGSFLPVHLESFFFSPAGYSYLSIPFIYLFGLNQFAVRFASALFGSLTILLVFLIAIHLFEKDKNKQIIALLSSLLLAISPWHVNLSRVAVESTIVVFFISLGILLYLKYIERKKNLILSLSFISFAATFLVYQAPRAFLPTFLPYIALTFGGFKKLVQEKFQVLLYAILIILPVLFILFSPSLSWRIQSLSIFNHPETKLVIQEQLTIDAIQGLPISLSRIFHNKLIGFSSLFLDNYFAHLSFDFLFSDGGFPDRFRIPKAGLLYLFELPLMLFALFALYKRELKIGVFLSGWILISFIGSALTFDDIPNLQRTLIAVPAFSILSGYGAMRLWQSVSNIQYRVFSIKLVRLVAIGYLLFASYNFAYYLIQYHVQGKVYRPWYRQDGYRELVKKVNELLPNYEKAVITSRESASTAFFLFYAIYDPKKFQEETKNVDMRKSDHVSFAKYEFSEEECPLRIDKKINKLTGRKGILYVNSSLCEKEIRGAKLLNAVKRVDNSQVFYIMHVD